MSRVATLEIQNFRGVPGELSVDLQPRNSDPPASLVVLGDNGSGKSSIADGLEFALRAALVRRGDPSRPQKKLAQSLVSRNNPYIQISFDDGTRVARGGPGGKNRFAAGVERLGKEPHPDFAITPFVLRRADIQGFWSLPAADRLLVFFDWFRDPGTAVEHLLAKTAAEAAEARAKRAQAELERAIKRFSAISQIPERDIPLKRGRKQQQLWNSKVKQMSDPLVGRRGSKARREAQKIGRSWQIYRSACDLAESTAAGVSSSGDSSPGFSVHDEVRQILTNASSFVTEAFRSISTADFVTDISLTPGADSTLDIKLSIARRKEAVDPVSILSEANLDLLALLVFVAVVEAARERGQASFLVLDDVFQSVDTVFRVRAWRYIVDRLSDWQLVIITHDRLWFSVITDVLRQAGHRFVPVEIIRWSYESGPVLRGAHLDPRQTVKKALADGDPVAICSAAGLLLEELCDRLSWTLETSVTRRRGDRYTLGDTWPSVAKQLNRTQMKPVVAGIGDTLIFRNLLGAHYNEWARSVSLAEARQFGEAVLALVASMRCEECGSWIAPAGRERWACRCEAVVLSR
jgi:AAA domain